MRDLKDYSGPFIPDLKRSDFSKEALVRAWEATSRCFVMIDGLWYTLIKEKYDEATAGKLDREIWEKMTWREIPAIQEALNIHGNDVEALFKVYQTIPDSVGVLEMKFELFNKNHGIYTITNCRALKHFEKHGKKELQETACGIDIWAFADTAKHFNPKMKCTNLKLPPRKDPSEPACAWEFKIED